MPSGYHHLTRDDRCRIYALKKRGDSIRGIGVSLGVSPLDSEPGVAAQLRLALRSLVEAKLREHWSPERTSGRFAREKVASAGAARICRHVWADRAGDWEVDTMIGGGHRGALVSMVDRATKFTPLLSMPK